MTERTVFVLAADVENAMLYLLVLDQLDMKMTWLQILIFFGCGADSSARWQLND